MDTFVLVRPSELRALVREAVKDAVPMIQSGETPPASAPIHFVSWRESRPS